MIIVILYRLKTNIEWGILIVENGTISHLFQYLSTVTLLFIDILAEQILSLFIQWTVSYLNHTIKLD